MDERGTIMDERVPSIYDAVRAAKKLRDILETMYQEDYDECMADSPELLNELYDFIRSNSTQY